MWLGGISYVLYLMQDTVKLNLALYSINRIRTVISLVPVEEVAFPLVVIDAGEDPDPWGLVRRSQDMVGEEDVSAVGMCFRRCSRTKVGTAAEKTLFSCAR